MKEMDTHVNNQIREDIWTKSYGYTRSLIFTKELWEGFQGRKRLSWALKKEQGLDKAFLPWSYCQVPKVTNFTCRKYGEDENEWLSFRIILHINQLFWSLWKLITTQRVWNPPSHSHQFLIPIYTLYSNECVWPGQGQQTMNICHYPCHSSWECSWMVPHLCSPLGFFFICRES